MSSSVRRRAAAHGEDRRTSAASMRSSSAGSLTAPTGARRRRLPRDGCSVSLLSVERADARHGLLQAVREVSLHVEQGETVALVGANGAGKTTLLRAIAGAHRLHSGRVRFDGADITAVP